MHGQIHILAKGQKAAATTEDVTASFNSYNDVNSCIISELKPTGSHFRVQVNLKG
jgi:hypothetical protein